MSRNRFVFSIDLKMAARRRRCKKGPNVFYYICGEYLIKDQRLNIRDFRKQEYQAYFGMKLRNQDKNSAPHQMCKSCTESLRNYTLGKLKIMRFGIPMVWREPIGHVNDYYFCSGDMTGFNRHKKSLGGIPILNLQGDHFHTEKRYLFLETQSYLTLLRPKRNKAKRDRICSSAFKGTEGNLP